MIPQNTHTHQFTVNGISICQNPQFRSLTKSTCFTGTLTPLTHYESTNPFRSTRAATARTAPRTRVERQHRLATSAQRVSGARQTDLSPRSASLPGARPGRRLARPLPRRSCRWVTVFVSPPLRVWCCCHLHRIL